MDLNKIENTELENQENKEIKRDTHRKREKKSECGEGQRRRERGVERER